MTNPLATAAAAAGAPLPGDAGEGRFNILPGPLGGRLTKPIREATLHHASDGTFAILVGAGRGKGEWRIAVGIWLARPGSRRI